MKIEHWLAIFVIFAMALFIPFKVGMDAVNAGVNSNARVEKQLYTSCEDAVKTIDPSKELVFDDSTSREMTTEEFYRSLATLKNFSYTAPDTDNAAFRQSESEYSKGAGSLESTNIAKDVRFHVPCLLMVDWDGYYISYTKTDGSKIRNISTEKYTFGQDFRYNLIHPKINTRLYVQGKPSVHFHITYRLDDKIRIDVLDGDPAKQARFEGSFIEAYAQFENVWGGSDALLRDWLGDNEDLDTFKQILGDQREISDLKAQIKEMSTDIPTDQVSYTQSQIDAVQSKINTKQAQLDKKTKRYFTSFHKFKNEYIADKIQGQVEFFINVHNEYYNSTRASYTFLMPNILEKDIHKMLKAPCVVAFFQDWQANDGKTHVINVYSICGAELHEAADYYMCPAVNKYGYLIYQEADDKTTEKDESLNEITPFAKGVIGNGNVVYTNPNNGKTYTMKIEYHKTKDCREYKRWSDFWDGLDETDKDTISKEVAYATASECAKLGANPCPECNN